jgi:ribosomal-protein-alanine N-acetyltransferase
MKVIETERLYLREMTVEDAENLYLLNLDTEVIKYTGDKSFENIENAKIFLQKYDHYEKYGFGRWAVLHKENHDFLGWCGLKYTVELDEVDIGFRFLKQHWNKGYATESARAALNFGFDKYELTTIVGRAMLENLASIKVLEKLGLKYVKSQNFNEENGVIYQIERMPKSEINES